MSTHDENELQPWERLAILHTDRWLVELENHTKDGASLSRALDRAERHPALAFSAQRIEKARARAFEARGFEPALDGTYLTPVVFDEAYPDGNRQAAMARLNEELDEHVEGSVREAAKRIHAIVEEWVQAELFANIPERSEGWTIEAADVRVIEAVIATSHPQFLSPEDIAPEVFAKLFWHGEGIDDALHPRWAHLRDDVNGEAFEGCDCGCQDVNERPAGVRRLHRELGGDGDGPIAA